MWWLPAAGEALVGRGGGGGGGAGGGSTAQQLLALAGGEGLDGGEAEAAQLLSLAAAQRMNTDVRRAVFVAVMGAADVVHAHERLLRLPLKVSVWSCRAVLSQGWVGALGPVAESAGGCLGAAPEHHVSVCVVCAWLLQGDQQREVVRVVVDCCLHEDAYNPFYALLIARLATHSKVRLERRRDAQRQHRHAARHQATAR